MAAYEFNGRLEPAEKKLAVLLTVGSPVLNYYLFRMKGEL
jgi:hypothetical protein